MARILMVNLPYAGHTTPTLPLARALHERGHAVSYVNAPEWQGRVESTGATFIPYVDYPWAPSRRREKRSCFRAAYDTVLSLGQGFDVLVYEMLFYPALEAARKLGIPAVRQFSQPAWNGDVAEVMRHRAKPFLLSAKLIDRQMMSRRTRRALDMPSMTLVQAAMGIGPELNIVSVPAVFQPRRETFDDRYLFVPPPVTLPTPGTQVPFADDERPLIYVSMGSVISSRSLYKKCIRAFGDKDVTVILTTNRVDPESLGALPENMRALSFSPQAAVLRKSDLFITHGGMNSVNEAMACGVPMLVLPVLNDQPFNAAQIERLGIGRRMSPLTATHRSLYAHAISILDDVNIRKRSSEVQEQVARDAGMPVACARIESLLRGTQRH